MTFGFFGCFMDSLYMLNLYASTKSIATKASKSARFHAAGGGGRKRGSKGGDGERERNPLCERAGESGIGAYPSFRDMLLIIELERTRVG